MIIPQGQEKKSLNSSLWQLKFFLPGDMTVPQGKKGLSYSLRQLKLLLFGDMIIPQKKNFLME